MSRDLYAALSDPTRAAEHGEDAEWLAQLSAAAAELRGWRRGSLAEAEFEDGLWADETDQLEDEQPTRLAASDDDERTLPARYSGGGWRVLLGLSEDGVPYALLEGGPDDFGTLTVGGSAVDLSLGVEAPLPDLELPPATLLLTDEDGQQHTLS